MRISVIGLGKLGACTAACFSAKGHEVIGVDINSQYVEAINNGQAPVYEPRLQELVTQSKGRLSATNHFNEAIEKSDITFLIVPTPSREDGHFSDQYLQDALVPLSVAFKDKNAFHTFVITSTVSPGTINKTLIPLIEKYSQKKFNQDFGVAYNPEFIALGSVITDFLNPDMLLIGESSERVGQQLEEIYRTVCETRPYIARMSLISAEIAKISLNSYVTMKISFANTLASLCEEIEGANVDDITAALGADKRIAPYYLKGGLGFGGPCFPRDNRAFAAFGAQYNVDVKLAKATDKTNQVQNERLCNHIKAICEKNNVNKVAIIGLSYKPCTPVIEESPAVKLIASLIRSNIKVVAYDPLAIENAKDYFDNTIDYAASVKECFLAASVCIFMTADAAWSSVDSSYCIHQPTVIVDCWRIFDRDHFGDAAHYIRLGEYHSDWSETEEVEILAGESVA